MPNNPIKQYVQVKEKADKADKFEEKVRRLKSGLEEISEIIKHAATSHASILPLFDRQVRGRCQGNSRDLAKDLVNIVVQNLVGYIQDLNRDVEKRVNRAVDEYLRSSGLERNPAERFTALETALSSLREEHDRLVGAERGLKEAHENEIGRMKNEQKERIRNLETKQAGRIRNAQDSLTAEQNKCAALNREIVRLLKFQEDMGVQERLRWEGQQAEMERIKGVQQQQEHYVKDWYQKEIDRIRTDHKRQERALKEQHEKEMERIRKEMTDAHNKSLSKWETKMKAQEDELRNAHQDIIQKKDEEIRLKGNKNRQEQKRLQEELHVCQTQLKTQYTDLQEQKKHALGEKESAHVTRMSEIQKKHVAEQEALKTKLQSTISVLETQITRMETYHDSEKNDMLERHTAEQDELRTSLNDIISGLETQMSEMGSRHESQKQNMLQNHIAEQDELETTFNDTISGLKTQMSEMETRHESQKQEIEQSFDDKKLELEDQAAREKDRREAEYSEKTKQMEEARVKLKIDFKKREQLLETKHADERERLVKEVSKYSAALLVRDDFTKPISDNEVKARFEDLAEDVDTLARTSWKSDQTRWTNNILRSSSNERMLKKQILKDGIWRILQEYVFASPFRVLGEEGRSLETQWYQRCNPSNDSDLNNRLYSWPEPEMETERWRYITIKECQASLRKPVPSQWDKRADLKKGFQSSMEKLREDLTSMLHDVAIVDENATQTIRKLAKKAATMWLDFGIQRCRLFVLVAEQNAMSMEEKVDLIEGGGVLSLVVVPAVKRFGDSKGLNLNVKEPILGCDGETVQLSLSPRGRR